MLDHARLDDGAVVMVTAIHGVEAHCKDHGGAVQQARPVHRLGGGVHGAGPEGKEQSDDGPDEGEGVGHDAEFAEPPGPVANVVAAETFPKEEPNGRDVGAEDSGNHKGDERVEGFGGADVDQT